MDEPPTLTVFTLEMFWAFLVQGGLIGLAILFLERWPDVGLWSWLAVAAWIVLAVSLREYAKRHPL